MNTVNKRFQDARSYFGYAIPWLIGGALAISSQLAGTAFQKFLEYAVGISTAPLTGKQISWYVAYIIVFFFILWLFYLTSKSLFRPRTKEMREEIFPQKRENLFIILSNINPYLCKQCGEDLIPNEYQLKREGLKSLATDLQEMAQKKISWPWQMALTAVSHHIGQTEKSVLRNIIVICSPESLEQFEAFRDMLIPYIKESDIRLRLLGVREHQSLLIDASDSQALQNIKGLNFEEFDQLTELITDGISLLKKEGEKEKNMIIDITGGQKVASIVAATLTFNRDIKAQYVSTNDYAIKAYDVVYGTSKIS